MDKKIVIALGGNALERKGLPPTAESQLKVIKETAAYIADIIEEGYDVTISHGNGPQVGRILLASEASNNITPTMPFDVCGAMSQGYIGYHLQQALQTQLLKRNIKRPVVSLITQVVVDKNDSAFTNPTKPIGPFYTKEEAQRLADEKGYTVKEDAGRGFRRVVPSPIPKRIVELHSIKTLVHNNNIVIASGGGGIPVIEEDGEYIGVAAVIDKDFASERLAEDLDADILMILTEVEKVCINFNKPDQKALDNINTEALKKLAEEGHFAPGSMLPKVKAAILFADSKEGRTAIISSLDSAKQALEGLSGTIIKR